MVAPLQNGPAPAYAEDWQTPTLDSPWAHYGAPWSTLQYYKGPEGRVHLQGLIVGGTGTATPIVTLPAGYRPTNDQMFVCHTANALRVVRVNVYTSGLVSLRDNITNTDWLSLSGISFRAA